MADEENVKEGTPESAGKPAGEPTLAEAHPELEGEFLKIGAVCIRAREALRKGGVLPGPLAGEATKLLDWAEGVVAETIDDRKAFDELVSRDRDTFATALRLKGDQQLIAQLIVACDDLREVLDR